MVRHGCAVPCTMRERSEKSHPRFMALSCWPASLSTHGGLRRTPQGRRPGSRQHGGESMKTAAAFAIASLTLTALTGAALAQSGTAAPAPAAKPAAPATTAPPAAKPAETAKPAPKMKHVV